MRFPDLERTLMQVVADGRIGAPVSIRCLLSLPTDDDPQNGLAALLEASARFLRGREGRVIAQRHAAGGQVNVLATFSNGRTASVTVVRSNAVERRMRLLAVGNRGVAQLQGEPLDGAPREDPSDVRTHWQSALKVSFASNASAPFCGSS